MKNRSAVEDKIEAIFNEKNIEFEKIEYDEDLNYSISVDGSSIISGIGNLEVLLYFSEGYPKCSLIMGNIYVFKEKENALEIANRINSKLNAGRVIVFEKPKQLIYLNNKNFKSYENIDKKIIEDILTELYIAIAVIYTDIKVMRNEK